VDASASRLSVKVTIQARKSAGSDLSQAFANVPNAIWVRAVLRQWMHSAAAPDLDAEFIAAMDDPRR